ncbi:MAG: hypothetical protein ABSA40_06450 [Candidatus Dormibacteria bacterium]
MRSILHAARLRSAGDPDPADPEPPVAHRVLVDANTRTFWSRGANLPMTLVEADPAGSPAGAPERVRAIVAAHERGPGRAGSALAGDPAFSETLFVELIRGGQYARAFQLLAPGCQRRWGSAERFAGAHRGETGRELRGVNVVEVRHLGEWTDPAQGERHRDVAELDVEYAFANGGRTLVLRRTVHLVAVAGRWRPLSYPEGPAVAIG